VSNSERHATDERTVDLLAAGQWFDYIGHHGHQGDVAVGHLPAWTVAEAKAKFSHVIEQARSGPQAITRNGRPAAVVVSIEEWERRTSRVGNLVEFFAASPLRGSHLDAGRSKDGPRDVEL
jgi:prevent-host-death family protein